MTVNQYHAALRKLGLSTTGKATEVALGVGWRQLHRYAHGQSPIPPSVVMLLAMYLAHGLPPEQ
jgi:hypothetical protein